MCYIEHITSRTRPCVSCGVRGSRENIEQGRGSSARRLCHKKRVKRVLPRLPKKPPRRAVAQPRAVPVHPLGIPGQPARRRLQNPQKTKEARCQKRLQELPRKRPVRRTLLRRLLPPRPRRRPPPRRQSSRSRPSPPPANRSR